MMQELYRIIFFFFKFIDNSVDSNKPADDPKKYYGFKSDQSINFGIIFGYLLPMSKFVAELTVLHYGFAARNRI